MVINYCIGSGVKLISDNFDSTLIEDYQHDRLIVIQMRKEKLRGITTKSDLQNAHDQSLFFLLSTY